MNGTVIFILLYIVLVAKAIFNWKQGITLYVIFSMLSPNLNIFGVQISFEILAFFTIIIILFIKKKDIFNFYKIWPHRQYLWLYFILILFSSMLSVLKYSSSINLIALFGYFRINCIVYMIQHVYKEEPEININKIVTSVLFVNFIAAIIQLSIPRSNKLFYDFYYKASLTPLDSVLRLGYFRRAFGTFGSPVLLGVFSLFAFALYIGFYIEKQKCKMLKIKILVSASLGLMALSKTAILGIPILLITILVLIIFGMIKVRNKKIFVLPVIIIGVSSLIVKLLERIELPIQWYINYLYNPLESLNTRYDVNSGILIGTYQVIKDNLIFGVGTTSIGYAFLGDSMYTGLLYTSGIIGLVLFFGVFLSANLKVLIRRNTIAFLSSIAIIMTGFAAPIHFNIISANFLAYVFHKAEE